jgi:hypothetical protein
MMDPRSQLGCQPNRQMGAHTMYQETPPKISPEAEMIYRRAIADAELGLAEARSRAGLNLDDAIADARRERARQIAEAQQRYRAARDTAQTVHGQAEHEAGCDHRQAVAGAMMAKQETELQSDPERWQ